MGQLLRRARRVLQGRLHRLRGEGLAQTGGSDPFDEQGDGESEPRAARPSLSRERARAYGILEVAPGVSPGELRSAYRRLCRKYHPDRFANDAGKSRVANELLAEVNAAYELLKR